MKNNSNNSRSSRDPVRTLKTFVIEKVKKARYSFARKRVKHPVLSVDQHIPNFVSDNVSLLYHQSVGPHSSCEMSCIHDPKAPVSACLHLAYTIKTNKHSKNWITVFHVPYHSSLSLSGCYGIAINASSDGKGGEFRMLFEDNAGRKVFASALDILESSEYKTFIFSKTEFKKTFWENNPEGDFDWSHIVRFGFYIGCGYKEAPVSQSVSIASLCTVSSLDRSSSRDFKELALGDFSELNDVTLAQYYWWGAGEDSHVELYPGISDTFGLSGVLHIHYAIKSADNHKNWVSLKHHEFEKPLNLKNYDFISLWVRGDGQGGQLRFSFSDSAGKTAVFVNRDMLNGRIWQKLVIPLSDLSVEAARSETDLSAIHSLIINIGTDWKKPPLSGDIYLADKIRYTASSDEGSDLRLLKTTLVLNQLQLEEKNALEKIDPHIIQLGNFSDLTPSNLADYYWWGCGGDANLEIFANEEDEFGINGVCRLFYAIKTEDSNKNWITLKRMDTHEPFDWSLANFFSFWIKGDGQGGHFRIVLRDSDDNELTFSDHTVLNKDYWIKLRIERSQFRGSKKFDFSRIKNYEFYVGLDWKKPPLKGNVLFSNLSRHTLTNTKSDDSVERTYVTLLNPSKLVDIENKIQIGDFQELNESNCTDLYWWGAGKDSSLKLVSDVVDEFGIKNTLYLTYAIDSDNSNENWITLKRRKLETPADWSNADMVSLWVRGDGQGGQFRILIRDNNNNELVYSDYRILNRNFWFELNVPIRKFVLPPWKKEQNSSFDFSKIVNYEFYIGLDWKKPPVKGFLYLSNFTKQQYLKTTLQQGDKKIYVNLYDSLKIPDISKLAEHFWWNCGPEASLKLTPNSVDPQGISGPMKAEFTIQSDDSAKNWVVIKHNDFKPEANWGFADGVSLWIKGDAAGGQFRLSLEDSTGKKAVLTDTDILNSNKWMKWTALFKSFRTDDGFSFSSINNYEFYIGLDWKKPPVESTIYFHDFSSKYKPEQITEKGSYGSFQQAMLKEKYNKPSYKKLKKALDKTRSIEVDKKLIPVKEFVSLLHEKHGIVDELKKPLSFGQKDICIKQSKERNKWGLDKVAMFIEPTNLCNLQCIMCNHGDFSFERGLGVMKFAEFKKLVDEIVESGLNLWEFVPQWLGETFIHPQIDEFILYASDAKTKLNSFRKFNVHTNGAMLEERHIELILNSKLDSILFSVDAFTKETYDRIRVGGDFDKVVHNIQTLLKLREKRGQTHPKVIVQFIVMDENHEEIEKFARFWQKQGIQKIIYAGRPEDNPFKLDPDVHLLFPDVEEDSIFIKSLEPNALTKHQTHREIIPDVSKVKVRRPCASLWRMFSISWDGNATACCRDDQVSMPVGNVFESGLKNVWYGDELRRQRIAHILGNFDETPKCVPCVNWIKNHISDEDVEDYLRSIGEESLIPIFKNRMEKERE